MDEPRDPSPPSPPTGEERPGVSDAPRPHRRLGVGLMVVGGALLVWAILTISSAGYGTSVRSEFSNRRPYDQIKAEVHRAVPKALLRALLGGLLVFQGRRLFLRS